MYLLLQLEWVLQTLHTSTASSGHSGLPWALYEDGGPNTFLTPQLVSEIKNLSVKIVLLPVQGRLGQAVGGYQAGFEFTTESISCTLALNRIYFYFSFFSWK